MTRPGLSFVSSAYASELFISLIHHKLGIYTPAHEDASKLEETDLGNNLPLKILIYFINNLLLIIDY